MHNRQKLASRSSFPSVNTLKPHLFNFARMKMFNILAKKEMKTLVTLEDWLQGTKWIRDPQDIAKVLLSDWPLIDKTQVLLSLSKKATRNNIQMRVLETQLDDSSYPQLAQVVRWLSFWNLPRRSLEWNLKWSQHKVMGDIGMHRVVQMEVYVQEEIVALQKSMLALSTTDMGEKKAMMTAELEDYESCLSRLNSEYWTLHRLIGLLDGKVPAGPLKGAYESWRADPNWYLCTWLRKDCAKRGGCCGRECGCCERVRTTATSRQWNRGHCTSLCGCCIRTQGRSSFMDPGQSELEDVSTFKIAYSMTSYSARINRAYIWGLDFLDHMDLL